MSAVKNFIQRVMDAIQGGEESKIARFHKNAIKQAESQIKSRKEKIDNLQEKINDLKDTQEETLVNLDISRLTTIDSTQSYVTSYITNYMGKVGEINSIKEEIETLNKEIEAFQSFTEVIK